MGYAGEDRHRRPESRKESRKEDRPVTPSVVEGSKSLQLIGVQ